MRKKPRFLKDITDAPEVRGHGDARGRIKEHAPPDLDPPRLGPHEARDRVDDRRLARARTAKKRRDARRGLEPRRKREIADAVRDIDPERHPRPPIRRATARPTHSDAMSAPIATATAMRTSRIAAPSPPGTCRKA